jgi:hypothetical protein
LVGGIRKPLPKLWPHEAYFPLVFFTHPSVWFA